MSVRATLIAALVVGSLAGGLAGWLTSGVNGGVGGAAHLESLFARAQRGTVRVEAGTREGPDGAFYRADPQARFGSGFFVSPTEVVTAGHVVYSPSARLRAHRVPVYVLMSDGERYRARVVAINTHDDVGLLSISGHPLVTPFAFESKGPRAGAPIVAVGSPSGDESALTTGLVSHVEAGLPNERSAGYNLEIALDLAGTEGSSGSPVLDTRGKVVGMILAAEAGKFGEPLQLAIAADVLRSDLVTLKQRVSLANPLDGATLVPVYSGMIRPLKLSDPHGLYVQALDPSAPLRLAGIRPGDDLLAIQGHAISSVTAALELLTIRAAREPVRVEWSRNGRREVGVVVVETARAPE